MRCDSRVSMHLSTGEVIPSCERVVDQPGRLRVEVYHIAMGVPFILCTAIGSIFCSLTKREDSSVFSENLLFVADSYYSPVSLNAAGGDGDGSTMYTWEISFWIYSMALHVVLVATITSPVDVFDTVVSVLLGVLSIMYLCRYFPQTCPCTRCEHALRRHAQHAGQGVETGWQRGSRQWSCHAS